MLQAKLKKAFHEAKGRRIRFTFIPLILLMLFSLWFFGVVKIDLSIFGLTHETNKQIPSLASVNNFVKDPSGPELEALSKKQVQNPKITDLEKKLLLAPNSPYNVNDARNAYQEMLIEFEKSVEPIVLSKGFADWNIEEQQRIFAKKNESIQFFSLGNYEQALAEIREADRYSRIKIEKFDTNFTEYLSIAKKYYEEDDYNSAFINISQALRLKPQSVEALELKEKISLLPALLENIQKAVIARTENNIDMEVKYLSMAVNLDPLRYKLVDRLEDLRKRVLENNFANSIKKGLASVGNKDLEAARLYLKEAQSIFKERSENGLLSKKVKLLELDLKVERLLIGAKSASRSDNWLKAETLYKEARKLQPNRKDLEEGYNLAKKINILSSKLTTHLQTPRRLSSPNVTEIVGTLVTKAKGLSSQSPSLHDKTTKLQELLRAYSKKIKVTVISNGFTDVSVRGVGKVGLINEKVIDLKPGTYTFEGKRIGYRSKLIQVDIPPNLGGIVVKISSDERI